MDDQKEDFSDLPPNQRRKKLQQKIDLINKEISKETAERYGYYEHLVAKAHIFFTFPLIINIFWLKSQHLDFII